MFISSISVPALPFSPSLLPSISFFIFTCHALRIVLGARNENNQNKILNPKDLSVYEENKEAKLTISVG